MAGDRLTVCLRVSWALAQIFCYITKRAITQTNTKGSRQEDDWRFRKWQRTLVHFSPSSLTLITRDLIRRRRIQTKVKFFSARGITTAGFLSTAVLFNYTHSLAFVPLLITAVVKVIPTSSQSKSRHLIAYSLFATTQLYNFQCLPTDLPPVVSTMSLCYAHRPKVVHLTSLCDVIAIDTQSLCRVHGESLTQYTDTVRYKLH